MANYRVKIGSASLGLSQEVVQVGWDSILEWKKDGDSINYQFNPKGNWLLNCSRLPEAWGETAPAIFEALSEASDDCETFECSVEVECPAGSDTWSEVWAGEFSSKDWKISQDKKTITVKAKENGPIDCLKREWKNKENIYGVGTWQTVKPYYHIYKTRQRLIKSSPPSAGCPTPPADANYCHYETESIAEGPEIFCTYFYHRYELPGTCSGATPVQPDNFTAGGWTLLTNNCPTSSLWWACPEGARVPYTFIHGLKLQDVLTYLFSQTGCGLTVKSDFFDLNADATHPANSAYTAAADYCHDLIIFQKSDIKRHDATNPATTPAFEMKLADLLNDLKAMFKVDWSITDSGATFRLEHVSYFEAATGNDYTTAKQKNELEADKAEIPLTHRFFYRDQQATAYFQGDPIKTYCGEGEKETRLALFSCDIGFIISDDGLESIGDDGFVLMTVLNQGGTLYNVTNNRPLSWTELHDRFHKWEMAGAGEINGAPVTPESIAKTRKQPAFIASHCCDDTFNPYDTITTGLGAGQVQSAGWSIAKDYIEIEPKY